MSHTVERLPGKPIILQVLHSDYQFALEHDSTIEETVDLLNQAETPLFVISDVLEIDFNLEELMISAKGGADRYLQHPNMRELIVVTQDEGIALAAKGLGTSTYGSIKLKIFQTREAALDYTRKAS